jgi:hypothetical protein
VPAELASDPIIVYGAPRSGTTYLEQILNAHPAIYISNETRVFAWLHHALTLTQDDQLVSSHRETFVEHLRAAFPQMIRGFYRRLTPEARYWGDKNPHYADPLNRGCLETVAELFPQSRFICIIRDGRDVVTSLMRRQAEGRPWVTFDEAHDTWKWHVHYGRLFSQKLPNDRYFEIRYEDLVADDVVQAAQLFRFLGIEFDPAVKAFCEAQHASRSPFSHPTRDLAKGATVSDWQHVFTPEQQARSLELIGEDLTWYGYETEASLEELRKRSAEALMSQEPKTSAQSAESSSSDR